MMSGLDIHYDFGDGHPLLGRRMPDLDFRAEKRAARLATLLHEGRPLLLNFAAPGTLDPGPWADRVRLVDAQYDGPWQVPVVGDVVAPRGTLVRPDGYVAWTGEGTDVGLTEALGSWFGPA